MDVDIDNPEALEFTLEDAYENLKDIKEDLKQELDDWIHRDSNNELGTLSQGIRLDEIKNRQHKLLLGIMKNLDSQEPRDLPLPNTKDLDKTLIKNYEESILQMHRVLDSIEKDMAKTEKNIAYLESNNECLEKMKSALSGAIENVGNQTTYDKEIRVTKRLFAECKNDLHTVVDIIFPANEEFKNLLGDLTQAYTRGGDDVYVDVVEDNFNFAKFLVEADIAMYHRNDKNKIKLLHLL